MHDVRECLFGHIPLSATIGRARVIEIQDTESIEVAELEHHHIQMGERILFKTINSTHYWQNVSFLIERTCLKRTLCLSQKRPRST